MNTNMTRFGRFFQKSLHPGALALEGLSINKKLLKLNTHLICTLCGGCGCLTHSCLNKKDLLDECRLDLSYF